MRSWKTFVLALVASCICSDSATADPDSTNTLVIRTYNVAGVEGRSVAAAEVAAARVLDDAGIDVRWRRCATEGPDSKAGDPCSTILEPREIVIRLVNAPRTFADPDALGYSYVDVLAQRGTLGTVFIDRIHSLAHDTGAAESELLGRAMAHEVGHMLLGTDRHSTTGLMKGYWPTIGVGQDWVFTPQQSQQMRVGLATRDPVHLGLASDAAPAESGQKKGSPRGLP